MRASGPHSTNVKTLVQSLESQMWFDWLQKRKLRKKAADEGGLDVAALEAEAAANDRGADRGSRAQKAARDAERSEAEAAELRKRRERCGPWPLVTSFERRKKQAEPRGK